TPTATRPTPAPAAVPESTLVADAGARAGTTREPGPASTGPVPATPSTRRLARELGVDLRAVRATGLGGRVTDDEVGTFAGGTRRPAAAPGADGQVRERVAPERPAVAKPLAAVGVEPPALPRFEQWGPVERQPLSHLRRTIAERMTLSATLI